MKWKKLKYDLAGQRFGRLVAIRYIPSVEKWECVCDCGNKHITPSGALRNKMTKSCGCLNDEVRKKLIGERSITHGKRHTTEYATWASIKQRCFNKNDKRFSDYGGRGITMCSEWVNGFEAFFNDMGLKPTPKHTIDRIDNDGNYTPENSRWATRFEQANNKRNNFVIEHRGISKTLQQWSNDIGMKPHTLRRRIKDLNWTIEKALTTPVRKVNRGNSSHNLHQP